MLRILCGTVVTFLLLAAPMAAQQPPSDAQSMEALWRDAEYQEFVEEVKSWAPPLQQEEQKLATRDLVARISTGFDELSMPVLQSMLSGAKIDSGGLAERAKESTERILRHAGAILTDGKRLKEISISEFVDCSTSLSLAAMLHFSQNPKLPYAEKRRLFDMGFTALDLGTTHFPGHPSVEESRFFTEMIKPVFQTWAPVQEVQPAAIRPITRGDIDWLRSRLEPWLERRRPMIEILAPLRGGLAGHASAEIAARFYEEAGEDAPFQLVYYQPERFRDTEFQCTDKEARLVRSAAAKAPDLFPCNLRSVEFVQAISLFALAGQEGEKIDKNRTVESVTIVLFVGRHYGDLLDGVQPGFYTGLRQWATEFVKTQELMAQDVDGKKILGIAGTAALPSSERTRQLLTDLREFLAGTRP